MVPPSDGADSAKFSPRANARIAGLLGVVMLASGSFAQSVATRLLVRDDAQATSRQILASSSLFRLGVAGSLLMMLAFLFYALLLYRLLAPVDRNQARAMLALVVASVPLYMLNQLNQLAVLPLAASGLQQHVGLFLELHRAGNLIAGIFFGLWLFPLGMLVLRSGFLPRVLGILLIVGSPGYVVLFVQGFLFPGSERSLWSNPLLIVTHLSEGALMLWLLVRAVDAEKWKRRALGSPVA